MSGNPEESQSPAHVFSGDKEGQMWPCVSRRFSLTFLALPRLGPAHLFKHQTQHRNLLCQLGLSSEALWEQSHQVG